MSRSRSTTRRPGRRGPGGAFAPTPGARSIRNVSLLLLVCVVGGVALLMVVSLAGFVLRPDPAVKAGPMYVTLALTTGAALLMLVMALNASFLPFIPRRMTADVHLVMWAMGITGIVTGLLTLGGTVTGIVMRLVMGSIAFMFITIQQARLTRARATAPAGQAGAGSPVPQARPHLSRRQRRGGRKR